MPVDTLEEPITRISRTTTVKNDPDIRMGKCEVEHQYKKVNGQDEICGGRCSAGDFTHNGPHKCDRCYADY